MATIITKNSSTASSVPLNTQLVQGELAVNVTDKRLFTENASGTVVELGTNPSTLVTSNTFLAFGRGNTEDMRLTSTGLGIGTSSPGAKLEVRNDTSNLARVRVTSSATTAGEYRGYEFGNGTSFKGGLLQDQSTDMISIFTPIAGQALRLTTEGNLGLGVTPSAWSSNNQNLEGPFGALALGTSLGTALTANAYYSGSGWRYKVNSAAKALVIDSNSWQFYNAPSGTAGNAISFTQALTLDSSGNLLVGTTNTSAGVGAGIKLITGTIPLINIVGASTGADTTYSLYNTTAGAFRFYVSYAGQIYATSTSISAISDRTLKTNVRDLETGLTEVMALKPRRFDWINGDAQNVAGFVAQEVEQVLPELVTDYVYNKDEDGNDIIKKSLKMGDILPTLVKAIQEQQAIINQLKAQLTSVSADVAALKAAA